MHNAVTHAEKFDSIEDPIQIDALNALSRSINIVSTYGNTHPAFKKANEGTLTSIQALFNEQKKITIGAFNGVMTVNETSIQAKGVLLKTLERRLSQLRITSLRIARGITETELISLIELLADQQTENFDEEIKHAGLNHITSEKTHFQAVNEGQTVANESDLSGVGGNGVLVLEDDLEESNGMNGDDSSSVHVDQIVAFLKGDVDLDDESTGEELAELASDPNRLGKIIMESVAIRQSSSELSGESLGDVVLGCLRRTYDGLRKQPAFQTSEGTADLRKALLLLEDSMLEKMRDLTGESNPELDRQIIQTIREMDEKLEFEQAATQYMEQSEAIEENKQHLQSYIQSKGENAAAELLSQTGFPSSEWRKIVVGSRNPETEGSQTPIISGLNTLATVFEKLETLIKSDETDGSRVKDLLGQANTNLDDTTFSTKEKLDILSKQLNEDTGTIGGHAIEMDRKELLSSIAEIAQELMQPLTCINASLEMMLAGYVGEVNEEQRDMLRLANNSGDNLKYLMRELVNIVGIPINRGVDKRFIIPRG